jgi:hypothetical protein
MVYKPKQGWRRESLTPSMITPRLDYAFTVRLDFPPGPRLRIPLRTGEARGFVAVAGGTISGPRLEGEVVSGSGGDWPLFRSDGVVAFDARYMFRARDGELIHVINRGYAHADPQVQASIERGESVDPSSNYFRLSPIFETSAGRHEWLTRSVFVGMGQKHAERSDFDYFVVL